MREQLILEWNSTAHTWWNWMWSMSWQLVILVLVLGVLTWLLRNRSARLRYALWLLVPVRLVLPPTLALVTGWGWWVLPADDVTETPAQEQTLVSTPMINNSETLVDAMPEQQPVMNSEPVSARPDNSIAVESMAVELPAMEVASSISTTNESTKSIIQEPTKPATVISWQSWLFLGWVSGVAMLLLRLAYGLILAYGLVRRSEVPHCPDIVELLENCRQTMGLRRSVRVRELEGTGVPMLVGMFRPTIILPKDIDGCLTSSELEAVIFHELHHVSRLDAFVNLAQSMLASVYFFHPFVWVANRVLSRLREDACDEATVAALKGQRSDYGTGIVKIAEMVADRPPGVALGIISRKGQVKRRLQRILDPRLSLGRRLSWSGFALLLVLGTILLPTAARPIDSEAIKNPSVAEADDQNVDGGIAEAGKTAAKKESSKDPQQKPTEDQVTLSGTVIDEEGKPAPKVKVFIKSRYPEQDRAETETDDLGRFLIHAPNQNLLLRVIHATTDSGRLQAQYQLPSQDKENDLALNKLRLQLQPARRVKLHVVDGVGRPIANAKTGIRSEVQVWGTNSTDEKGNVVFLIPQDVPIQYVFALSKSHGVDYKAYVLPPGPHKDKFSKPPTMTEQPIRLTLDGVRPLHVQVREPDDLPISGVKVYPWYLKKSDQPQDLNLSYFSKLVQETTDQSGNAVLAWIPHWQKNNIMIRFHDKDHVRESAMYSPEKGNGTLTMKLDKLVSLKGRVTFPDGSPAKNISITVSGRGHQFDPFRSMTKTDRDGRYSIKAAPNMVYLIIVNDKEWASTPHTGFALLPGKPIDNLDFKLRPATRLFGRVTVGSPPAPVKGQVIYVYQRGEDAHIKKELKLPNPKKKTFYFYSKPTIVHSTSSDENGEYELFVGDGKFDIRGPALISIQKSDRIFDFEISGELEKEFKFHAIRPKKAILEGTVVTGNPRQLVSDAEVAGIYRATLTGIPMKSKTDKSGHFKVERELHRTVVYAHSKDKKLAGVVEIGPDDKTVTVPIRPLGTAFAQLVDAKTKEPLRKRDVRYGVEIRLGDNSAPYRTSFGETTTTDNEGRFEMRNLVLGQNYNIRLANRPKDQLSKVTWRHVGKVKPEDTQPINLGVLEIDMLLSSNKPSSTKKLFATATQPAKKESSEDRQQEPPEDLVTLSGTVVDAEGKPARKVKVFIDWKYPKRDRVETETDDLGRFSIHTPSQKLQYGLVVQAIADSGQQQAKFQLPYKQSWEKIENDQSLKKLRLQLHPARRVELNVVDGAGKPISKAKTGIMSHEQVWGINTTDEQGNVEFLVPQDVQIKYVFALSSGHGVDYKAYVFPRGFSGGQNARAPVLPDHPIHLMLAGVKPLQVQVVETDDSPIAGIQVNPWTLEKPDQPGHLNLSFFVELVQETTDQSGKATFDWIPHWHKGRLTIWPHDQDHVHQRAIYEPKVGNGTLTMKLDKLVPLKGRVTFPDGSPAKGISIRVSGEGHQFQSFQSTAKTDKEGRYTIKAPPNMIYLMIVNDQKWASTPHSGFVLWPEKPIANLDFKLRPATRLFGRVTVGSPPVPVKGQKIEVIQYETTIHKTKDQKFLDPNKRNRIARQEIEYSTSSDKNGEFELFVGDGKFEIRGPEKKIIEKFEITGDLEKQFAFHVSRPEAGFLEGTVVSGNPPQPVAGASVLGIYRHELYRRDMLAVTDASGNFKVDRSLHGTVIYARSKDKKMAGIVSIGPDDKKVTIPIGPLGTVTGQLIDTRTKKTLKERKVSYGVKVSLDDNKRTLTTAFGGTTTTDVEGHFKIRDLVLGQNYDIRLLTPEKNQPDRARENIIGKVKPEDTQPIDLGVLKVASLKTSYKPPTTKKLLTTANQKVIKEKSENSQQEPPKDHVTLSGTVLDEEGKPAAKVKVFVEWKYPKPDRVETETDNQGRFLMHAPSQKVRYQVVQVIADSGQQQAQYQLPWQNIENDQSLKKLRLQLRPARRVELHVVDGVGKPIKNAKTGIMSGSKDWGTSTTDAKGNAKFLVPHDVQIQYVFALSNGHGVDYKAYVLPRGRSGDQNAKPPVLPNHPVKLTLDGVKPLQVQVVETDDSPIAGLQVYPWYLEKPDQPQDLNLSFFTELIQETTDQSGKAVFNWMPHWQKNKLTIWPRGKTHVHERAMYDPKLGNGTLTMKLDKLVPLKGRVTFPDGSPAKNISISVSGEGHQVDSFRSTTKTDKEGRYTIKATPNMVYLVIVKDKKWASTPQTGFALWPGKPINNLDFKLRPATRLFGRVTIGSPPTPVKGQLIYVYQYGVDAHNKKELKLPNPKKKTLWVQPTIVHSISSDENGEYELFVGNGKFDIRGPRQNKIEKFEITGELEKQFDFHAARPEKGLLEGSVVSGNPPQPVSGAEVFGIYRHGLQPPDMRAVTDGSGQFKVERALHRTVIYARSKDKKLAGVVEIGPDDKTVTIPIRPLGTAFAKLIDVTTKEPLKEREIKYGVDVHLGDNRAPFRTSFGGTTTTDSEGRFEIRNLVLGQNYKISLVNRPKDQPNRITWRTVDKVKPEDTQPIDLGVLEVAPPYKRLTTKERIATAFKVKGTPLERLAQAKRDAKITIQRPLILFGDPKGEAVQQLMTMRYKDQEVRTALESFIVLAVDASADKQAAAKALAQTLRAKLENGHADFFVIVADEQGKPIANADVSSLSTDGKISKEKFINFVKANTLPPLDAQELLETALQQAKKENKRIIIQETATWCAPCRLLSRFLEKARDQWERDYIWIKMDHRWTGASEMMKTMRDGADGGVPWWAILDKDGKVLITSNGEEGKNIGFPSRQNERAHFRTMLEKTAIRLTPEEIGSLVDALKSNQ